MSHGQEVGVAVTGSPWPTLWAPGPAACEVGVSHGQEVGAAVTGSPWPTLWAGLSQLTVNKGTFTNLGSLRW